MDMQTMAALLAFVLLAACALAPFMQRQSPPIELDPYERELEPVSRPWARKTTDEG